ncbi:MAG: GNAT family N-acetyltransferase, partial [Thermoplasmata archaeon]
RIVGFILSSSSSEKAEIKWIGVAPGFHRRGIGSELFLAAERELRSAGTEEIRVKTVAAETEYEPYEKSRAFYERMGFRVETVVKTRSGDTGEEFGMATYVKEI